MSIEITHVRFASFRKTESEIIAYRWRGINTTSTGENDKSTLVSWIKDKGGKAYVGTGGRRVDVRVVEPSRSDPYLRTYADGVWTNNLVALPTF